MSATTTGIIAVTLGLIVFFWDATRNGRGNSHLQALRPDLRSDSARAAVAGFVSAVILIVGQELAKHYWGHDAGDLFFYWYVGVAIAAGVIAEFVRRMARKCSIRRTG